MKGAETSQEAPPTKGPALTPELGVGSFLHLPLNLTRPGSSSLLPPKDSGILPIIPSLLTLRATSPRVPGGEDQGRVVGSLPSTAVGRSLTSSIGGTLAPSSVFLCLGSWGLHHSHSPRIICFSCVLKSPLYLSPANALEFQSPLITY